MTDQLPEVVQGWLEKVRPEHRDLLTELHNLLVRVEPDFSVALKWGNPAYSVGGQMLSYLADQSDYVHLGFYNGAQFEDRHGIVDGTGKRLRHVKVRALDDEFEQKLVETIEASLAAGSEYSS